VVSKVLNEQPFSSTKYIAAQLRASGELVKRTLIEALGMKKFISRWVSHEPTAPQKAERVVGPRKSLWVLRVHAANGFVNIITADENWYYWSDDHSLQWNTSRHLVPTQ
jgi:hypothetical protein